MSLWRRIGTYIALLAVIGCQSQKNIMDGMRGSSLSSSSSAQAFSNLQLYTYKPWDTEFFLYYPQEWVDAGSRLNFDGGYLDFSDTPIEFSDPTISIEEVEKELGILIYTKKMFLWGGKIKSISYMPKTCVYGSKRAVPFNAIYASIPSEKYIETIEAVLATLSFEEKESQSPC